MRLSIKNLRCTGANHSRALSTILFVVGGALLFGASSGVSGPTQPSIMSPSVAQTGFAYVTPAIFGPQIDQFSLGSDGSLASFTPAATAGNSQSFGQMTFATVNGVQYAYILDPNGAVYWCTINANGSFSNCAATASTPALGTWQARGIAFATFNAQSAYIVDPGNNLTYQCAVGLTGNFTSCQTFALATLAPYGIAFATSANATQQAYIADAGGGPGTFGDVLLCSMLSDGSFSACNPTPSSGAPNWIPYAVAFTNVNGTQYAYVADNGAGTPGHVYRCSLNNDGTFVNSSCVQTPANDSALTDWYPYYIAFHDVNGTKYAYVVNSVGPVIGNIYRCAVDSSGMLSNCVMTPANPPQSWQPSGIAFRFATTPGLTSTAGGPVTLGNGTPLTDSAALVGGVNPTGTITFTLRDPSNTIVYTDVVTVNGNGSYTTASGNNSGGYLPRFTGDYLWNAVYSGDSSNDAVSDNGQNETENVSLPTAAGPVISPVSGTYRKRVKVTITDSTPGAEIHYTLDGSTPTSSSPIYTEARKRTRGTVLILGRNTTVKAIAIAPGYNDSAVSEADYVITH